MVRNYTFAECEQFLRSHLPPSDIHWSYSLDDAMGYVRDQMASGGEFLIGDLDRGVLFRVSVRNPKVIEPHLMGNALQLRSVARECLDILWQNGVEQVVIWTQYKAIASIVKRMGFEQRGYFPRMHMINERLVDIGVYCLEKP